MIFNDKLQRGVQDHSFTPIKVAIHRDSSHEQLLTKSIFSNTSEGTTFYLSDGSGHRITDSDFSIDLPDGTKECLPWTLCNYILIAGNKRILDNEMSVYR